MSRRLAAVLAALAVALLLAATAASAERPDAPPGQSRQGEPGPTHGPREDGTEGAPDKPGNGNAQSGGNGGSNGNGDPGPHESGDGTGEAPNGNRQDDGGAPDDAGSPAEARPEPSDPQPSSPEDRQAAERQDASPAGAPSTQGQGAPDARMQNHGDASRGGAPPAHAASAHDATHGGSDAPGEGTPRDAATDAPGPMALPPLREAADHLEVHQGRAGAIVAWTVPADAAQVQVWRRDGPSWTPVAAATAAGSVVDPTGEATSEYRLTWTTSTLAREDLAAAVSALPLVPAVPPGSPVGAWLLALLGAGGVAFATVRAPGARQVPESRVSDEHQLLPTLVGVPGIDGAALERVAALGLRTVGQLRALDPDALAFWANVPAATVRRWHDALELLQWPALPAGAAHRLARAGAATLADVAAADPERLWADLREGVGAPGPGLPVDMSELAGWVADARQAVGVVTLTERPVAPAAVGGHLPAARLLQA